MTAPTVAVEWPWAFMCSGVIAITITITACDTTSAMNASRARGWAQAMRTACVNPTAFAASSTRCSGVRSRRRPITPPATTRGSGRMSSHVAAEASPNRTIDMANPPALASSATRSARSPATPMKLSPFHI